jgi:hypothetical protein
VAPVHGDGPEPEKGETLDPHREVEALRQAVLREGAPTAQHRSALPVTVGPPGAESWEVEVHEFEAPRGLYFAWVDTSDEGDPPRVVVVKAGPEVQSAEQAVQVDLARRAKEAGES